MGRTTGDVLVDRQQAAAAVIHFGAATKRPAANSAGGRGDPQFGRGDVRIPSQFRH